MLRKACISIAAAAMVITGSVSAANAIQVDAGGGRWDYGMKAIIKNWSMKIETLLN